MNYMEDEVPKYKKKKESSTSRSREKSKYKHEHLLIFFRNGEIRKVCGEESGKQRGGGTAEKLKVSIILLPIPDTLCPTQT